MGSERFPFLCPSCGPIKGALYGDDELFHCDREGCDAVVRVLTERERSGAPVQRFADGAFENPEKPKVKPDPKAIREDARRSREILARMAEREALRKRPSMKGSSIRSKKPKPTERSESMGVETKVAKHLTSAARRGTCGECGNERWLLSKEPPRCSSCHRQKAVTEGRPYKPRSPRKGKPPKGSTALVVDDLAREVQAIEQAARALDGLGPEAAGRVLRYVADRYVRTTGQVDVGPKLPELPA